MENPFTPQNPTQAFPRIYQPNIAQFREICTNEAKIQLSLRRISPFRAKNFYTHGMYEIYELYCAEISQRSCPSIQTAPVFCRERIGFPYSYCENRGTSSKME